MLVILTLFSVIPFGVVSRLTLLNEISIPSRLDEARKAPPVPVAVSASPGFAPFQRISAVLAAAAGVAMASQHRSTLLSSFFICHPFWFNPS